MCNYNSYSICAMYEMKLIYRYFNQTKNMVHLKTKGTICSMYALLVIMSLLYLLVNIGSSSPICMFHLYYLYFGTNLSQLHTRVSGVIIKWINRGLNVVCDGACLKTNKYRNMVYEKGHAKLNKHNVIIIIGHIDFRKINIKK